MIEPVAGVGGFGREAPQSWIAAGSEPQTGIHVAFAAADRAAVDAFYAAALTAGGRDNGPPGPRPIYHEHYYGTYVLDPDGNNAEAVCHRPLE
jgi:catechol 2,3-dioxygenase-like lactoylglutathione lyase family enzyme